MVAFRKAVKHENKLRMALAGPAGSGKTYTALTLAAALAGEKPVAVIDTERGSASMYADLFSFDVCELESFHPDRYVEAIRDAAAAGYGAVVIDSLSHAWNGTDGLLELVEKYAKRERVNTFQAWGLVKPIENRLVEAITSAGLHVIATMRTKTEYVVEEVERNGRKTSAPRKVGLAPVQRDGFEYEFDVFGEMTPDNELIVQKTRCPQLTGAVIEKPGRPLADTLRKWLSGAPAPAPVIDHEAAIARRIEQVPTPAYDAQREAQNAADHEKWTGDVKPVDPWQEVRDLAAALKLSAADREALFTKHKKNRDKILADLRQQKAERDAVPEYTIEELEARTAEPAQDNGDPDLLHKVPALKGGRPQ